MLDEKLLLELQAFVAKHHQPHALLHVKIIEDLTKTNRKPPHTLCVYVPTPDPEEEDEEDELGFELEDEDDFTGKSVFQARALSLLVPPTIKL